MKRIRGTAFLSWIVLAGALGSCGRKPGPGPCPTKCPSCPYQGRVEFRVVADPEIQWRGPPVSSKALNSFG